MGTAGICWGLKSCHLARLATEVWSFFQNPQWSFTVPKEGLQDSSKKPRARARRGGARGRGGDEFANPEMGWFQVKGTSKIARFFSIGDEFANPEMGWSQVKGTSKIACFFSIPLSNNSQQRVFRTT